MNESRPKIKIAFVTGLGEIVLNEVDQHHDLRVLKKGEDSLYLDFVQDLTEIKSLRSVSRAYLVMQNPKYNPLYVSNHKSIPGNLIEIVTSGDGAAFNTFKITCAGSDSPEVRSIARYIRETYDMSEAEEADLKIHIVKLDKIWEIGVQITPRPLSSRNYKMKNMSGAMDSTIAYAVNSLCELEKASSYLNVFSGSATLLIEAGQCYPNLKRLVGFDNNKKHISLAIQNIKKAGLIKRIQLKEMNILNKPNLGKFNVITSDLPFGMSISKNEDLKNLYRCFIEYCEEVLSPGGILAAFTSEVEMLEKVILRSRFRIVRRLRLKLVTMHGTWLYPQIFLCNLKNK